MTKVMTVVGTRPEIIRLSAVIKRLDASVEHVLVHTGQNYDYELNEIFFEDLGLRKPDHFLNVDVTSLGKTLGEVLSKTEEVITLEKPDALVVLGDTNSCIAALMAKRMRVPVYHMEAGNRCFDENVPEETNRRMVDHVSDFNLVYTEHARRNLLAEGLHPRRILLTGSPMREVLLQNIDKFLASDVVERMGLEEKGYVLVSAHREENVDRPERLNQLLDCLEAVAAETGKKVLVSTHPRTRKRLDALGRDVNPLIDFHAPMGFIDYVALQMHAHVVLSDSGTISEESSILGFPAVTLRDAIERPEALDTGAIIMTGLNPANVLEAVKIVLADAEAGLPDYRDLRAESQVAPEFGDASIRANIPADYAITNCSERAVRFIVSTAARHHQWAGIRV